MSAAMPSRRAGRIVLASAALIAALTVPLVAVATNAPATVNVTVSSIPACGDEGTRDGACVIDYGAAGVWLVTEDGFELPPCATEDSGHCWWDGPNRGNGTGRIVATVGDAQ